MLSILAAVVLTASPSQEGSIDGVGRISVSAGYRFAGDEYFYAQAAAAQMPVVSRSIGGPAAVLSFGYGALSILELSVDAVIGYESFTLDGLRPFTNTSYGGFLGGRLVKQGLIWKGFTPYFGVGIGALLSTVTSLNLPQKERLLSAYSAQAGFLIRVADNYAVNFEVRYVYCRNVIPQISGLQVGGLFASVGFTMLFPSSAKKDLEVPGFR